MAPSTPIGAIIDELVASLVPPNTALSKLRKLKDNFSRQLRHHNYARTNQFEVAERLDGLQEKFLVLNHEELADALHDRLRELKIATPAPETWLPDVLHLLLQLSDDPVRKIRLDDLDKDKICVEEVRPLRWAEVELEDPIDRKSKVWEIPDFSDLSSDEDDIFIAPIESSSPSAPEKDEDADEISPENAYLLDRDLTTQLDDDLLTLRQIWKAETEAKIFFTELQAVRETLFMLQGLPTTLFWRVDHSIEIDKRFCLDHASVHILGDVLESFVTIGLRVDLVRMWLKRQQTVPVMQSVRVGIEETIRGFDSSLSQIQSRLLAPQQFTIVSLAKLSEDVIEQSRLVMQLANFLENLMTTDADGINCLDLLYTTICSCQASGAEDLLEPLAHLFLKSFEVYLKPIWRWVELGELDSSLKSMFSDETTQERSLTGLWHDWYKLKNEPGPHRAPRLMQPLIRQIFVTGKTVVFLRYLPNTGQGRLSAPTALAMAQTWLLQPSGLIPFSDALETAIKHAIGGIHRSSSVQLREKLDGECSIWRTLDALHSIFLGKSGWIMDAIDARIFERIDQGSRTWNDRYLLVELCRNAFQGIESIDADRITVRASRSSLQDMQSQRKSVKMLEDLALSYTLPWPVANIVSTGALQSYQRISMFLFQIRRARYVLERRCRITVMSGRLDLSLGGQHLAQAIHCQLLIFVNYLYDHLTLFSIEHATAEMHHTLTAAMDVDGMIQAHQSYMAKLEEMCLVSRRVNTIKMAIVIVLDLCIRFSDKVTSSIGPRLSIDAGSSKSASSRLRSRPSKLESDEFSSDEGSSDSEGFSTFVTFDKNSFEGELRDIKQQMDRQRSFIVAGIKSTARVEEQRSGWDMLAERLDWKTVKRP